MPSPKIFVELVDRETGQAMKKHDATHMSQPQRDRLLKKLTDEANRTNPERFYACIRQDERRVSDG